MRFFLNSQAEGKGIYVQSNGCTYEGDWKKDQQEGLGKDHGPKDSNMNIITGRKIALES